MPLQVWAHRSIRLSDIEPRARQLGELARIGEEALSYIDAHIPPPGEWHDARAAVLSDAEKPSALVRFVFLPDLRRLLDAAGKAASAQ